MITDRLLRGSATLFFFSIVGSLCNYFFQFIMGRMLSVSDFGSINSLMSLMVIIAVPAGTLLLILSKYTSEYKANKDFGRIKSLHAKLFKAVTLVGCLFLLAYLSSLQYLRSYLNLTSTTPIIILGFGILWAVLTPINMGVIQGLQKFVALGIAGSLGGLFRIIFGVLLVYAGLGMNGAILGIVLSSLGVLMFSFLPLKEIIKFENKHNPTNNGKEILLFSLPAMLMAITLMSLTNVDLIMVKHYFSSEQAGLYASVAVLGRTIIYLPGAIVMVMFPMVAESHTLKTDTAPLLKKGLVYTLLMSGVGLIVFLLFPKLMVTMLFGHKFVAAAPYLKWYAGAMIPIALLNIIVNHSLARRKKAFIYFMLAGCLLEIILINTFHASLNNIIFIVFLTGMGLFLANITLLLFEKWQIGRAASELEKESRKAVL